MDVNKLMNALDNENNESIMNLTSKKIFEMNFNIIKELHLDKPTTLDYLKKLKRSCESAQFKICFDEEELCYKTFEIIYVVIFKLTNKFKPLRDFIFICYSLSRNKFIIICF